MIAITLPARCADLTLFTREEPVGPLHGQVNEDLLLIVAHILSRHLYEEDFQHLTEFMAKECCARLSYWDEDEAAPTLTEEGPSRNDPI